MVLRAATRDEIIFLGALQRDDVVDESDVAQRPEKILIPVLPSKKKIEEHDTLRHCQDRS